MGSLLNSKSDTPKKYLFVINSEFGNTICDKEPIGWKDAQTKLGRDWEAAGVFASYSVDSLTFLGNGAAVLDDLFRLHQVNAQNVKLTIKRFNNQTLSYDEYPIKYSIKLGTWRKSKIGRFAIGTMVNVEDSSALSKFDDRKNKTINITGTETLGGMQLNEFAGFPALSKVKIPALYRDLRAVYWYDGYPISRTASQLDSRLERGYNSVPAIRQQSDFSETFNTVIPRHGKDSVLDLNPIFGNSTQARTLKVTVDLNIWIENGFGIFHKDALSIRYSVFNDGVETSSANIFSAFGQKKGTYNKSTTFNVNLIEGDSLYIYVYQDADSGQAYWYRPSGDYATETTIKEVVANTTERIIDGLPIVAALARGSQMVLDNQYAFYSEFFGLTDFEYANGQYYLSEGSKRFGHILSGLNMRGLTIYDSEGHINIKLIDLLNNISKTWCTGYCIQSIAGTNKIRVENRDYFFNTTEILDLSGRINKYDIVSEYIPELAYLGINTGYKDYNFRSNSGRGEYNTENSFTTQLANTDNELDLVSGFNASTNSMLECLGKPIGTTSSEDTDYDDDVFILKTQRDSASDHEWIAETNEEISIDNDSSLFGDETSLNLAITPARNMIRNAELYTPALQVIKNSKLKFQTTKKLSNLQTTGEGRTVKENADIELSSLPVPKIIPIKHTVEVEFTYGDLQLLLATGEDGVQNRYKLIKFTDEISGFIYSDGILMRNNEDKATVSIIQFNKDYV